MRNSFGMFVPMLSPADGMRGLMRRLMMGLPGSGLVCLLTGLGPIQPVLAQTTVSTVGSGVTSPAAFVTPPDAKELKALGEGVQTAIATPAQRKAQRSLVIRLSQRRVYVYEQDHLMVSYPIAVGKQGWETPTGDWEVFQMIQDPSWQHPWTGEIVPPGPDNPLGRRWIGFWTDGTNVIGFHGTPNENLVGQAVSHGCIRMKNSHIQSMFELIAQGATVRVDP